MNAIPQESRKKGGPLRVAILLPNLGIGGAEILVVQMLSEFLKRGGGVFHLIVLESHGKLLEEVKRLCQYPDFSFVDLAGKAGWKSAWRLGRYLARHRIDILHAHLYPCEKCGIVAKLLHPRLRVIATKHSTEPNGFRNGIVIFLSQFFFARIVFISDFQRTFYLRKYLVFRNTALIENGCKVPEAHSERETLGGGETARLACIGSHRSEKGHDILVDALNLISRRGTRFQCDFFGDGPEQAALEAQAKGNAAIRFHAAKPGIARELGRFDLVILPSRREGFPLLLLEAFLAKVPLVVSDYPTLAVHAANGVRAITFQSENFRDLAEKIEVFLESPRSTFDPMVEAAWRYASEFTIEKAADRYLRLYRDVHEAEGFLASKEKE